MNCLVDPVLVEPVMGSGALVTVFLHRGVSGIFGEMPRWADAEVMLKPGPLLDCRSDVWGRLAGCCVGCVRSLALVVG